MSEIFPFGEVKPEPDSGSSSAGPNRNVLEDTVQRTLLDMGLGSGRLFHIPLLPKRHRQLHLRLAQEHRNWNIDQWKNFDWSDESWFVIHHVNDRIRIRRLLAELMFPQ